MHNRIIDAIQEQYGEKYATLEDALNWWAWPEHWRRGAWDSDFVTGMKTVKTAFNRPFKKEEKGFCKSVRVENDRYFSWNSGVLITGENNRNKRFLTSFTVICIDATSFPFV